MNIVYKLFLFFLILCSSFGQLCQANETGIAMHGSPALGAGFDHFPYANPDAPKGGKITYGVVGTFDGLNPFVIRSFRTTARGLFADEQFGGLVYESLMVRTRDEPFTLYGLIADNVILNDDRTEITFHLNPKARFSDGKAIKADDVLFTVDLLKNKGRPPFDRYMKRIEHIEKLDEQTVKMEFPHSKDREFPFILASSMPVLPKHAIDVENFEKNGLTPIPGSGPYIISHIDAGERIIYERDPNYWGKDLPVNRGLNNFDRVQIEYFRNDNTRFEAFKKGILDVFLEEPANPNRWRLSYNFPAVRHGDVIKESFKKGTPADMIGFVFNTRKPIFKDRKVRQALSLVFDFEWVNHNLFNDVYSRTEGFWCGSTLSAVGRPASDKEKQLLSPYPGAVLPEVMDGTWHNVKTDGSGIDRASAEKAWQLLREAGYKLQNRRAIGPDGQPLHFEIMTQSLEEEKIALAYQRSLVRIGVGVDVRTVDDTQYQNRLTSFDYDMIVGKLKASLSPGNEQLNRWGSSSRDLEGSFNFAGTSDPAIDAMISALLDARSNEDFTAAVRALDRVLISGSYYLPLYHLPDQWVAHWSRIEYPAYTPLYGYRLPAWWHR
ncbi:extracellular solute-binding protein [Bartonella apis]|uniref:extracellular solute-binding protein n=1 Tax=Bartonella apis TaxID=1686310 RepID=UPI00242D723C|nr:extracellular solute-binding protein [Bartonella apis]